MDIGTATPSQNSSPGFAFPRIDLPESQKDAAWHRSYAMAAIRANLGFSQGEYTIMSENFKRYNSLYKSDAYNFLQVSEDGGELPAAWIDFNHINPKVNLLVGDALRRAPKFRVTASNKDARSRKLEKEGEVRVKMKLRPFLEEIQQGTGLELSAKSVQMAPGVPSSEQPLPKTDEELQILMRDNYKGISEICLQRLLNYLVDRTNWKIKRAQIFMNLPIAARAIVKVEFVNGLPAFREIDPRLFFFDRAATDHFLADAAYMGTQTWMAQAEVLTRFNITAKQLSEMPRTTAIIGSTAPLNYTRLINNQLYWMVTDVEWADTKPLRYKKTKDSDGLESVDDLHPDTPVPVDAKPTDKGIYTIPNGDLHGVKSQRTVRHCTMVGDRVVEFGELQNQVKSVDDLSMFDNGFSYVTFLPYWTDGANVSMVSLMSTTEDLRNIAMYNVQLAMNRAVGRVVTYDMARLPPGMSPEKAIHYMKANNIVFYNSAEEGPYGGVAGASGINEIDISMSDTVHQLFELLSVLNAEQDTVTGVSAARQGVVENASQAVGVTQSSLGQSNLQTAYLYNGFDSFSERLFTKMVNMAKVAYTKEEFGEHFSQIFGDASMAFFRQDVDLAMDDYAVKLEAVPDIVSDRGKFEAMVQQGIQMGAIPYAEGMTLLMEPDTDIAIRMLKYEVQKAEEDKHAREMAAAQQQQQADGQNAVAQANAQGMSAMQIAHLNAVAGMEKQRLSEDASTHRQNEGNLAALHRELAGRVE